MAGPPELLAYLGEMPVAVLMEVRSNRIALTYTDAALAEWRLNTPVLSVSLPLRPQR